MFSINNQLFVSIKVDGNLLPLGGGQLDEIVITETVNQFLPTIEIKYIDRFGLLFSNPNLYDGKVISVSISTNPRDLESNWRDYIVYPRQVYARKDGFYVQAVGFLDAPDYIFGGSYNAFNSSSSDVARQIASVCGFNPIVDSTNDKQTWLMTGQSRAKFLKDVCNHAYSDSKSTYINFVDRNRNLYFVDVSRRRSATPKYKFQTVDTLVNQSVPEDTILVPTTEFLANFNSDVLNSSGGYGIVFRQFDFTTGNETLSTPKDYVPFTKYLNINPDIKGTRFDYCPPQIGNTHKNYAMARFQNFRNKALYSTSLLLTTPLPKLISLFDRVQFTYYDNSVKSTGSVLDGAYFVERIVQTISYSSFLVNYGLIREGINSDKAIPDLEE